MPKRVSCIYTRLPGVSSQVGVNRDISKIIHILNYCWGEHRNSENKAIADLTTFESTHTQTHAHTYLMPLPYHVCALSAKMLNTNKSQKLSSAFAARHSKWPRPIFSPLYICLLITFPVMFQSWPFVGEECTGQWSCAEPRPAVLFGSAASRERKRFDGLIHIMSQRLGSLWGRFQH